MFTALQIVLILLFKLILEIPPLSLVLMPYGTEVLLGAGVGAIMGDVQTGLVIGGTMGLMSIGANPLGGSVVPDYSLSTILGTAFACATGSGLEVGLAFGLPTGTLAVNLTVVSRMIASFFYHKALNANERHDFKGVRNWIWGSLIPSYIISFLPITLLLLAGSVVVESILNVLPYWLLEGFTIAGGILPAVGFAVLLSCLPLKDNFVFVILGYALYAFAGISVIGVTLIAFVFAWVIFQNNTNYQAKSLAGGGIEDDE